MNSLELRKDLHNLIDSIENDALLLNFYELIKGKLSNKEGKLLNNLSEYEINELYLSFKESESSYNLISDDEMKKKHQKWL